METLPVPQKVEELIRRIGRMTIEKEESRFSEKELFHLQLVHQKFYMDCTWIKIRAPWMKNRTAVLTYSMEQKLF
jgi:hypothetical protein